MRLHPATELTVRLVDVPTITVLNEKWMGSTGPTDVLSFPMDELNPGRTHVLRLLDPQLHRHSRGVAARRDQAGRRVRLDP